MVVQPDPSSENPSDDARSQDALDALDDCVVPFCRPAREPGEPVRIAKESARGPEKLVREVLGAVLREERIAQDRTLADVAESAHVSLAYLSEVERGTKEVSSPLLQAITTALEVQTAEVLERCAQRLRFEARAGGVGLFGRAGGAVGLAGGAVGHPGWVIGLAA